MALLCGCSWAFQASALRKATLWGRCSLSVHFRGCACCRGDTAGTRPIRNLEGPSDPCPISKEEGKEVVPSGGYYPLQSSVINLSQPREERSPSRNVQTHKEIFRNVGGGLVSQACPTHCDPTDFSPPGPSVCTHLRSSRKNIN